MSSISGAGGGVRFDPTQVADDVAEAAQTAGTAAASQAEVQATSIRNPGLKSGIDDPNIRKCVGDLPERCEPWPPTGLPPGMKKLTDEPIRCGPFPPPTVTDFKKQLDTANPPIQKCFGDGPTVPTEPGPTGPLKRAVDQPDPSGGPGGLEKVARDLPTTPEPGPLIDNPGPELMKQIRDAVNPPPTPTPGPEGSEFKKYIDDPNTPPVMKCISDIPERPEFPPTDIKPCFDFPNPTPEPTGPLTKLTKAIEEAKNAVDNPNFRPTQKLFSDCIQPPAPAPSPQIKVMADMPLPNTPGF